MTATPAEASSLTILDMSTEGNTQEAGTDSDSLTHDHSVCGHQDGICNPSGEDNGASRLSLVARAKLFATGQSATVLSLDGAKNLHGVSFAEHAATLFCDGEDWEQLANPRVSAEEIVAAMLVYAALQEPVDAIISQFAAEKVEPETILGLFAQKLSVDSQEEMQELRTWFEKLDLGAHLCIEGENIVVGRVLDKLTALFGEQDDTSSEVEEQSSAASAAPIQTFVGSARASVRFDKVMKMRAEIAELEKKMAEMSPVSAEFKHMSADVARKRQYVDLTARKLEKADADEVADSPQKEKTITKAQFLRIAKSASHDMTDTELEKLLYSIPYKWWPQILPESPLGVIMVKKELVVQYTANPVDNFNAKKRTGTRASRSKNSA